MPKNETRRIHFTEGRTYQLHISHRRAHKPGPGGFYTTPMLEGSFLLLEITEGTDQINLFGEIRESGEKYYLSFGKRST